MGEHRRRPAEMASFGNSKYQSGYLASRSRPAQRSSRGPQGQGFTAAGRKVYEGEPRERWVHASPRPHGEV